MSTNSDISAGTTGTGEGAGTETQSSVTSTGGSISGSSAGAGKGSGSAVQSNSPLDAPANAPQSGTPAFAKPGEGTLTGQSETAGTDQSIAQNTVLYPLRLIVDGHQNAGRTYDKGQTIALDAPTYRWAIANKIGEPGKKEDVGLPVDESGNAIKPTAPAIIALPDDQQIALDELSAQGTLQAVEDAAKPADESQSAQ